MCLARETLGILNRGEPQEELDTRSCRSLELFEIVVEGDVVNVYYLSVVQPSTGHVQIGPPPETCFLNEAVIRVGEPIDLLYMPLDKTPFLRTGPVVSITPLVKRRPG